jgi:hypothetical protein
MLAMMKWILGTIAVGLLTGAVKIIQPVSVIKEEAASMPDSVEFHEGQLFPTTVFPSILDGRPRSVGDFRGKKLILHIFASW